LPDGTLIARVVHARQTIFMASALVSTLRPTARLLHRTRLHQCPQLSSPSNRRSFINPFRKIMERIAARRATPLLSQDNLFHPLSKSPFPAVRERGEAIKKIAPCPVCLAENSEVTSSPKAVKFECPDCGWPTHCSEEHWAADEEHKKYCSRLREVNEDDHDLRSGRRVWEFEFPGETSFYILI
jgi:mitochondrial splicing suppressor protein 51